MSMTKHEVARIFDEIGLLLELKGESSFKSRAYYKAARTIEALTEDLAELVASGRVRDLPGIGQALSAKLAELVGTGHSLYHEELKRGIPPGLLELSTLPRLGPKKVMALWQQLGIASVGELEYACIENRLVGLKGFGQKTQDRVRQAILQFKRRQGFHLYLRVAGEAERLCAALRDARGIRGAELVGDLRRRLEIVQNISIVVGAGDVGPVLDELKRTGAAEQVDVSGSNVSASSIRGIPLSVAVVPVITPHVLLAATGSPAHLAELAARATHRKIPWHLEADEPQPRAASEQDLYAALGLPYIEPELREGLGEIEEAEAGRLKALIQSDQIQGIFHTHTTFSDGADSLDDMVAGARTLGYRYIGISDHSQSAFYANGLKEDRIREQHAAIEPLRTRFRDITILKGIEADILVDGALDYPDDVLARFDFVIASVHSRFNLSEEEQTTRVVRALANPYTTMLGHPTGRLLLSREGYRVDVKRMIGAAREHGKTIEINASPHRLDLDWRHCRFGRSQGVRFSINPDAHSVEELHNVPFGVNVARKAGLSASDVINTLGVESLQAVLQRDHRP
jgi:DNA polymerase (family 10)